MPENRTASARDELRIRPARTRTRTGEVGARRAPAYTTGLNDRSIRWSQSEPVLSGTPGWSRTSVLCRNPRGGKGDRLESNRYREAHNLGCSPLHHGHHGFFAADAGFPRPLTHVLESARSRHAPAKPERTSRGDSAGGIRTHDLELMRLARTAAPPPRSRRAPPAGLEPAASGLRARRHLRFDHGGPYSTKRKERESNPKAREPTRFETGYRAGGSPSEWPRQASNLQPSA